MNETAAPLFSGRPFLTKLQIYKVGANWVLWVPGVRVYRFTTWESALQFALEKAPQLSVEQGARAIAAAG